MEIHESTRNDREKLKVFMELVDAEFYPPLSDRPGGITGRILAGLARGHANYLMAEMDGTLTGVLGYRLNREAYISFFAVHPEYRGMGIARALDKALEQKLAAEGIACVNVTTWSTNPDVCRMYRHMGYRVSRVVKDDRGPGVDTVYFKKALLLDVK